MKNLITLITAVLISTVTLFASNGPIDSDLVSTEEITVISLSDEVLFNHFDFDANNNRFDIDTKDEIAFIQIFSAEGELEFQLPVSSTEITLNKNLFSKGESKLGFVLSGNAEVQFAQVSIK